MTNFQRDNDVIYAQAVQRRPGLQRVLARNPGPFSYTGTGTYILGTDRVAVIDPGPDMDEHFEALMAALAGRTVTHILVTHTHLDHSPLSRRLADATGAQIYAYGPHGSGRTAGLEGEDVEAGADTGFLPDIRLNDGDCLEGDVWTLTAIHTPGHTSNHMCFYWCEEQALFSGDHVMGWSTTVVSPPDGDMRAYMNSLDKLIGIAPKLLIPTHGPVIDDAVAFMRNLRAHRQNRERQILSAVSSGAATIPALVQQLYADVDPWLHPAAARSVLAHLIDLVDRGALTCSGAAAGGGEGTPGLDSHYHSA